MCDSVFIAVLFTIAKTWKPPQHPSTDKCIKKLWCVCMYVYVHTYTWTDKCIKKLRCVCMYVYIHTYTWILHSGILLSHKK